GVTSATTELHPEDNIAFGLSSVSSPGTSGCALTCPANITVNNTPNEAGATVSYSQPTTSGACGTVTCDPPSGAFFSVGVNTATCTADTGDMCTFTITVIDTRPVITISGDNPLSVECHTSFTDPGATATDASGNPLQVTTTGTVDPNTAGTYTL